MNLPIHISSYYEIEEEEGNLNTYANCKVCRNFCNVLKLKHRRSKAHQEKMTCKLRAFNERLWNLRRDSKIIGVFDSETEFQKAAFCYFCDKTMHRVKSFAGYQIDYFGYMTHMASPEHAKAVKVFLKYHERDQNFDLFCISIDEYDRFVGKIPEAIRRKKANDDLQCVKDSQYVRDIEDKRKKIVAETIQNSVINSETSLINSLQYPSANISPIMQKHDSKQEGKLTEGKKNKSITWTPWQIEEDENQDRKKKTCSARVIGPTAKTFDKHVDSLNNKIVPNVRLSRSETTGEYTSELMVPFRGVWNKGKRKNSKSDLTNKRKISDQKK